MTVDGDGCATFDVVISDDPSNIIECTPAGLFAAPFSAADVTDTSTTDMQLNSVGALSTHVKVDPSANNDLQITASGLYVPKSCRAITQVGEFAASSITAPANNAVLADSGTVNFSIACSGTTAAPSTLIYFVPGVDTFGFSAGSLMRGKIETTFYIDGVVVRTVETMAQGMNLTVAQYQGWAAASHIHAANMAQGTHSVRVRRRWLLEYAGGGTVTVDPATYKVVAMWVG